MLDTMVKNLLKAVHETQGVKTVHHIEVREAVKTPGGMTVYIPIKKTRSLQALGLIADSEACNE